MLLPFNINGDLFMSSPVNSAPPTIHTHSILPSPSVKEITCFAIGVIVTLCVGTQIISHLRK